MLTVSGINSTSKHYKSFLNQQNILLNSFYIYLSNRIVYIIQIKR